MKPLNHIEIAIRVGFAKCVEACGGGANMAAALECNAGKVSKLQNIENTPVAMAERLYLKASEVIKADLLAGRPYVLSELAAIEGYEIHKADRQSERQDMHHHLSSLAKEFGEACAELADGGSPSIAKARRIRSELQDLINRGRDCVAECDQIIAGSNLRAV